MTKTDLTLRPPAPADRPDWRRLWTGYLDFYETRLPDHVHDSTFARLLTDDIREPRGLMAFRDGKAVGLVHYIFHRHCWRVEDACYLQDLFADPEARGSGVGRALIEGVYAAADAAGCPAVYWTTQDFNLQARQLYDRIGVKTPFIRYNRA